MTRNAIKAVAMMAILAAGALSIVSLGGANAYAQQGYGKKNSEKMMVTAAGGNNNSSSSRYNQEGRASGQIASIQNDEKGQPAWVASGHWRLGLAPSENSNNTNNNNNNTNSRPGASFLAKFTMVKTDGTSKHMHTISDFVLTNMSDDGNTTTLTGKATMTMKDGPQKDIPATIKILNHSAISIMLDSKVNSHLGNTPLYGTVTRTNNAYHERSHAGEGAMMMTMTTTATGGSTNATAAGNQTSSSSSHRNEKPEGGERYGQTGQEHVPVDIVSGATNKADKAYSPSPLTVKAGTEVTWRNKDTAAHTVTSGKSGSPDGVFDSKILGPNKEFDFEFKNAGTFDYYCQLHPAMVGKVIVQ